MISQLFIRKLFPPHGNSLGRVVIWALPLFFSLAFTACEPDAAPPTTAGSPPVPETSRTTGETAPPPSVVPLAELAKAFADSTTTLLEMKTAAQFSQVKMINQAVLTPGDDGLMVKATGNDPALLLPPFAAGKQFILQVVIESPTQTGTQLFYALRDAPNYNETHSQKYPLIKGRNVVYFQFNQPDLIDPVRLDPGYNAGDYKIESIVAREIAKPATP